MNKGILSAGISPNAAIRWLFYAVGMMIPVFIGVAWPVGMVRPQIMNVLFRPAILSVALVLAVMCGQVRTSMAELKLAQRLALLSALWLCTAFAATDVQRALAGWLKVSLMCMLALLLSRALRNAMAARAFGHGMILSAVITSAFTLYMYFHVMGAAIPTPEVAGQYKGHVLRLGVSTNVEGFTGMMTFILAMCLLPTSRFRRPVRQPESETSPGPPPSVSSAVARWSLGAILLFICTVFTGSRTVLAMCVFGGFAVALSKGTRSRNTFVRYQAFSICAVMVIGIPLLMSVASFKQMSDITNGRWDLWYVAVQKFSERPVTGYGFESVQDDLYARQPGVYPVPKRPDGKFPGGYHNEYLATLAEEGLIGFIPLVALFCFLMKSCWQLAFLKWQTWQCGVWPLFTGFVLLIRACDEMGGLFGYANSGPDCLAYIFLAIVVSRFSIEEERASAVVRSLNFPAASLSGAALRQPSM